VLDCFVAISHELDCLLQLKLLLAAFLLECLCFGFLTVEAHIDALDVASEVFKLLLKIADLGLLSFEHLLGATQLSTRMLDAVVQKFNLLLVLASLPVLVFYDLFKNFLVLNKVSNLALALL
jgi:hypothetical protein